MSYFSVFLSVEMPKSASTASWLSRPRSQYSVFSYFNLLTKRNAVIGIGNGTALPVGAGRQGLEVAEGGGVPRVQPLFTNNQSQKGAFTMSV